MVYCSVCLCLTPAGLVLCFHPERVQRRPCVAVHVTDLLTGSVVWLLSAGPGPLSSSLPSHLCAARRWRPTWPPAASSAASPDHLGVLLLGCVGSDVTEHPFLMAQVPRSQGLTALSVCSCLSRACQLQQIGPAYSLSHVNTPWARWLLGGRRLDSALSPGSPVQSPGPQCLDILSLVSPSSWRRQQTARRRESKWFSGSGRFSGRCKEGQCPRCRTVSPEVWAPPRPRGQAAGGWGRGQDGHHVRLPALCRGQQSCFGQSSVRAIQPFRNSALPLTLAV